MTSPGAPNDDQFGAREPDTARLPTGDDRTAALGSGVPRAGAPGPEVLEPEASGPGPGVSGPEASGPGVSGPGVSGPGAEVTGPEVAPPGPVIAQIGDIQVTSTEVRTPAGSFPLKGTTWQVTEQWWPVQKTPTWAIVVAILAFCVIGPFSLLFLLVRETVHHGTVQVAVSSWTQHYVARIPVNDQAQIHHIQTQANYVRSLASL